MQWNFWVIHSFDAVNEPELPLNISNLHEWDCFGCTLRCAQLGNSPYSCLISRLHALEKLYCEPAIAIRVITVIIIPQFVRVLSMLGSSDNCSKSELRLNEYVVEHWAYTSRSN
jgi:hypothetical protein